MITHGFLELHNTRKYALNAKEKIGKIKMDAKQKKRVKKWLMVKAKITRGYVLLLVGTWFILGMLIWNATHSCSCNCSHAYKEIGRLEAQNTVCSGEFNEGVKSVFLDNLEIIICGVLFAWIFHGVGFHFIKS